MCIPYNQKNRNRIKGITLARRVWSKVECVLLRLHDARSFGCGVMSSSVVFARLSYLTDTL